MTLQRGNKLLSQMNNYKKAAFDFCLETCRAHTAYQQSYPNKSVLIFVESVTLENKETFILAQNHSISMHQCLSFHKK